jgi:hypothetical protein
MSGEDVVQVFNPQHGAMNLPVIGVLRPGWNDVPASVYDSAPVPWDQLPKVQIRDPRKGQALPQLDVKDAVSHVLDTNSIEALHRYKRDEKRKAVLTAIDHQMRVLDLENQDAETLRSMLESEARDNVRTMIEKALKLARKK